MYSPHQPVERSQRFKHLGVSATQRPCQLVDPQAVRQVLVLDRLLGWVCGCTVYHVFSSSPRARHVDAATRGLRYEPGSLHPDL
jgi:hypothetical protein